MGENGRSQYRNRSGRPSRVGRSDSSQPIVDFETVLAEDSNTPVATESTVENLKSLEPKQEERITRDTGALVDNLLIKIFGDSDDVRGALKENFFIHPQNKGISQSILALRLHREAEHPEFKAKFKQLEDVAQKKLGELDKSSEFSRQQLRDLLADYKRDLLSLVEDESKKNLFPKSEFLLAEFLERDCDSFEELDNYLKDISGINYISDGGMKFLPIDVVVRDLARIRNSKITVDASSLPESIKNTLINFLRRLEQREQNNSFNNNDNNMSLDRPTNPPEVEQDSAPETPPESPAEVAEEINENIDQAAEQAAVAVPEVAPEIKKLVDDSQNEIQDVLDEETGKMVKVSKAKASPDANYHFVDVLDEETGKMVKVSKANSEIDEILDEETGRMIKFGQTKTETSPSLKNDKEDIDKLLKESQTVVEQDPQLKEARRRLDRTIPETKAVESNPGLEKSRGDFWTALRQRGNVWSKGRNLLIGTQKKEALDDFEKIRAEYNNGLAVERDAQMKSFVESLDVALSPEQKNAQITKKYIELLQAEEKEVDKISSSQEVSAMTKFKSWWKKTARVRMVLGLGLFVAGTALTAGATVGLAAGFVGTRALMSGAGSYMTAEGALDTRTKKLGQKGLIDDLKNIGFKFGEKGKVSAADKELVLDDLANKDKYPLEVLEKEYARLRDLSLDKSSNLVDAGRFGAEQALLVQAVVETYQLRKAEQFLELTQAQGAEQAKATMLASFLQQEDNATKTATSEQDLSRMKAIKRNVAAGALGLTLGLVAGSSAWDKVSPEDTTTVDPGPGAVVPSPETVAPVAEVTVGKGDTVWGLVENHLHKTVPNWEQLNEAQRTRWVDYFENIVVAKASVFGLADPDHLQVGTKINWGDLFSDENLSQASEHVQELTKEQMVNIEANNDILQEAARNGVEITSKNVDTIINDIRAHGLEQYLAEHGHGAAKAVASNAGEMAAAQAEVSPDIVDAATKAAAEAVDSPAVGALEQSVSDDKVEGFLTGARAYTRDIYQSIQSYAETAPDHAHEQMSALVNKIFESSPQVQQQFLHDFSPSDFTADNNKGTVFLELLKQTDVKINEIDTIDQLKDLLSKFDSFAHSGSLPTSDAFEPRLLNLGSQDGNVYAFVKKASGKFLGLFGEKKYLIDDGTQLIKVGEKAMSAFLQTNKTV